MKGDSTRLPFKYDNKLSQDLHKNDIDIVKLKAIRIIRIYRYYFFLSRLIFYCEIVRHVFFTLFGSNFSLFLTACKSPAYFLPRRERKSKDKLRFPLQIGGGLSSREIVGTSFVKRGSCNLSPTTIWKVYIFCTKIIF